MTLVIRSVKVLTRNRIALKGEGYKPGKFSFEGEYIGTDLMTESALSDDERKKICKALEKH